MSLLSGFNVTLAEVALLGQASLAAFQGGAVPAGWTVLTPQQLGVAPEYWDGPYFTNNGASAIVLQKGDSWIVAFRGSDGSDDIDQYPELAFGNYVTNFQPLLSAVAAAAPIGTHFYFTGASLGGGATNELAEIVAASGGVFASAKFVAFASPEISNAGGTLNVGFENDPIYKAISGYGDYPSTLDNLVLATSEYMAGNFDGQHPFDTYAHSAGPGFEAVGRLQSSTFYNLMSPDAVVIFDAFSGPMQDITPGRENTGAFYLGEAAADVLIGRNAGDYLEGFGGADTLSGGFGGDVVAGGFGADLVYGNQDPDLIYGNQDGDTLFGGQGSDTLFGGQAADVIYGNLQNDVVYGNLENDTLYGGQGDDTIYGGGGDDVLFGNLGNDTLFGNLGGDVFVFGASSGTDTVVGFNAAEGDRVDLQGQSYLVEDRVEGIALALSGGGTVVLIGVEPVDFSAAFLV